MTRRVVEVFDCEMCDRTDLLDDMVFKLIVGVDPYSAKSGEPQAAQLDVCDVCVSTVESMFPMHSKTGNEPCPLCDRTFQSRQGVAQHMTRAHYEHPKYSQLRPTFGATTPKKKQ